MPAGLFSALRNSPVSSNQGAVAFRLRAVSALLLLAGPITAGAAPRLLNADLRAPRVASSTVESIPIRNPAPPDLATKNGSTSAQKSFDFDLLGTPPPTPVVDDNRLRLRRTLLNVHQGMGLGLVALQLTATVTGQLSYSDRFAGGPSTGKYQLTHAVFAYATLAAFTGTGLVALLTPAQLEKSQGVDRVTLHQIAMFLAASGMVAQGVLGIVTHHREGYLNQERIATAHLIVSYVTLAAVLAGVGVIVF